MDMMRLIIDDRESHVIPFFKKKYDSIEIDIKRINIGDYAVYDNKKLIAIIERKTWQDLSASIKDGRKENIKKLILARAETGCKILYIIEGRARYKPNRKIARIPYKNLLAHLDHIMIRDNVFVIYSDNKEDTAARLIEFTYNCKTLNIEQEEKSGGDDGLYENMNFDLTQTIPKSEKDIIYSIWRCVPSITDKTADLFIKKYHISDLLLGKISETTIASMKYPSGAIIGKRSKNIYQIAHNYPAASRTYVRMLTCINGITKKTAELILSKFEFKKILTGDINIKELELLQKTPCKKLGKKVSSEILRFFTKNYDIHNL